jgi:hypothetical protein
MGVYARTQIVYLIDVISKRNAPAVLTLSLYYHEFLGDFLRRNSAIHYVCDNWSRLRFIHSFQLITELGVDCTTGRDDTILYD